MRDENVQEIEIGGGAGRLSGMGVSTGLGREVVAFALGVVALAGVTPVAGAAETAGSAVVVEWDRSPEPDIAGYRIYWGTAPRSLAEYPNVAEVAAGATAGEIRGLVPGTTYYSALTAYNTAGLESGYSAEISFVVESANEAPVVTLSTLGGGSKFEEGEPVPLIAVASDPDGEIASVAFRAGSLLIGADVEAPHSLSWKGATAGTHTIRATATDGAGASTVSEPLTVTVLVPAPKIASVSPADGGSGGGLTFRLTGIPREWVRLEWSDDHLTWNLLKEGALNDRGFASVTDPYPLTAGGKPRFYRVRR